MDVDTRTLLWRSTLIVGEVRWYLDRHDHDILYFPTRSNAEQFAKDNGITIDAVETFEG